MKNVKLFLVILGIAAGIAGMVFSNLADKKSSELNNLIIKNERSLFTVRAALDKATHKTIKEPKETIKSQIAATEKIDLKKAGLGETIFFYKLVMLITQLISIICLIIIGFLYVSERLTQRH